MNQKFFFKAILLILTTGLVLPMMATDVGVKGGIGVVKGKIDPEFPDFEMKFMGSFQIGAFVSLNISDLLTIQPELNYSVRGGKGLDVLNDIEGKWKIGYIDVPILVGVNLPVSETFKLRLYAGPYVAMKLSAKEIIDDLDEETDIKDRIKNMDAGAVVGAQISLPVGTAASLILDARYCHGVTNNAADDDPYFSGYKFFNRSFVFSVGFGFDAANTD